MIEFNRIRKEFHQNGLSINPISKKYGISWAIVEKPQSGVQVKYSETIKGEIFYVFPIEDTGPKPILLEGSSSVSIM